MIPASHRSEPRATPPQPRLRVSVGACLGRGSSSTRGEPPEPPRQQPGHGRPGPSGRGHGPRGQARCACTAARSRSTSSIRMGGGPRTKGPAEPPRPRSRPPSRPWSGARGRRRSDNYLGRPDNVGRRQAPAPTPLVPSGIGRCIPPPPAVEPGGRPLGPRRSRTLRRALGRVGSRRSRSSLLSVAVYPHESPARSPLSWGSLPRAKETQTSLGAAARLRRLRRGPGLGA